MKLKIISDGTARGSRVVNADTGEEVENVSSVSWHLDGKGCISTAEIGVEMLAAEITFECFPPAQGGLVPSTSTPPLVGDGLPADFVAGWHPVSPVVQDASCPFCGAAGPFGDRCGLCERLLG